MIYERSILPNLHALSYELGTSYSLLINYLPGIIIVRVFLINTDRKKDLLRFVILGGSNSYVCSNIELNLNFHMFQIPYL